MIFKIIGLFKSPKNFYKHIPPHTNMFKQSITQLLSQATSLNDEEINSILETPPKLEMGDYSFPCFTLVNREKKDEFWQNVPKDFFIKKSPVDFASHLKDKITSQPLPKEIEKIEQLGPYINFFINKTALAKKIISIKQNYGKGNQSGKIMIEFSQPNTHKAFHVGHIRGTALGESLARILEHQGKKVVRANYSGDTGMHIAKWIWCYLNHHPKEKLTDDEEWIAGIYVDAVKRLLENEELQIEVDEINKKIEEKTDKKINELWKKTRTLSIKSWDKIYQELGTKFDRHYFESELEIAGKTIAMDLLKKNIAELSEEAVIMNLKKENLGVWILLRKDGTVLYSAKDLALAKKKIEDQNLAEFIIISGDEQNLHFEQLFKTLELMKFSKREKFKHLGFGMVRMPSGKMSSRTGDNILYSNFKEGVVEFAKKGIQRKWKNISKKELENRALKIAMASIKYSMLGQDAHRIIVFDKEKALSFEGNTGPYLQYTYARASSIIKKSKSSSKTNSKQKPKIPKQLSQEEIALFSQISKFPETIERAGYNMNPAIIANYAYELAKTFNEFYHNSKVLNHPDEAFKLKLIDSFRTTLKNSLYLLGIDVMEEM